MTLIWYINLELGTRALFSHFETAFWKNFIIVSLQLILTGFIVAYYIGK